MHFAPVSCLLLCTASLINLYPKECIPETNWLWVHYQVLGVLGDAGLGRFLCSLDGNLCIAQCQAWPKSYEYNYQGHMTVRVTLHLPFCRTCSSFECSRVPVAAQGKRGFPLHSAPSGGVPFPWQQQGQQRRATYTREMEKKKLN